MMTSLKGSTLLPNLIASTSLRRSVPLNFGRLDGLRARGVIEAIEALMKEYLASESIRMALTSCAKILVANCRARNRGSYKRDPGHFRYA